jgi:hypothetical protein
MPNATFLSGWGAGPDGPGGISFCSAPASAGMLEGSHAMTASSLVYVLVSNDWVLPSKKCNGAATLQGCQPSVFEETMEAGTHIVGAAEMQGCQSPAFKRNGPIDGRFSGPLDPISSHVESLALGLQAGQ